MNEGLEALERYRFLPTRIDYDIIEQELKRLAKIDDLLEEIGIDENDLSIWFEMQKQDGKKVIALEIIKEKRVNVDNFLNHIEKNTDYKEYKRLCGLYKIMVFSDKELTEEEFDLLKEVLL